ncbi:hypothetical protein DPMN_059259 [Dreissena polymorpha]|uniref:Uncharacterized protein n=1 Tax=Dreissena polymorpha TaxID=45954 RepID=A0A9D4C3Q0_DREPO|nr:hypothetical protein DPMN_059259 [Dreissena polymorpha]
MNLLTKSPPLGSHVFQAKVTIFALLKDISGTYLLNKFHEDRKINVASRVLTRFYYSHIKKNAPPPGGHVFQPTGIIFELVQDIIGINLLTNHIGKNATPLGSHVFQANVTIFELIQDIIETNLLTKFHENWKYMQMLTSHNGRRTTDDGQKAITKAREQGKCSRRTTDDGQRTTDKRRSQKLTMSTLCSGVGSRENFRGPSFYPNT